MAKVKKYFVCSECGYESAKWYGQCPGCNSWNCMEEQIDNEPTGKYEKASRKIELGNYLPVPINEISTESELRYSTGMHELDRVLGGGIVKGSLVLLGGDPGIGKSTILIQICGHICKSHKVLYVSGEESGRQLKLRAQRLGVENNNLLILTDTDVERVVENIRIQKPELVIIDSIQTMNLQALSSSPGSVAQVRECTNLIMKTIKALEIPTFIVGHVNKDGAIAGPKVLEHIVDAVLYFEGDRHITNRILRAVKNRYGSTNEIGVFEMRENGLKEVENPSMVLLSGRPRNIAGTCIACVMEGSRPILSEVQGLATPTAFGNPRRMSTGFDYNRMALLLAVLEKRAGFFFSNLDTYVNVAGGFRLDEPAADLAVVLALISSLKDKPIDEHIIAFGEIGLVGEIRAVPHASERIREAARLGFNKCVLPIHNLRNLENPNSYGIELVGVRTIRQAYDAL